MAMAALLLLPLTMKAQYNEDRYGLQPWFGGTSLLGKEGTGEQQVEAEFTNETFSVDAPLGSGIVILIGAGLGYVALKKKEDEQ